jgi:hypothetical protein
MSNGMENLPVLVAIEVAGKVVELGVTAYKRVRALFDGSDGTAADDAALAKLDAAYAARIEQAKKDAAGV